MVIDDELSRYLDGLPKKVRAKGVIKDEAEKLSAAQKAALRSLEARPDEPVT